MAYKPGILLGQVTKTSGFEGAVLVKIERKFIDNIPELESVFLEIDGRPVPFFVSLSEYQGADIVKLSFDGYNSVKKTEEFRGARVFLTTPGEDDDQDDSFGLLAGFALLNQENKVIGSITDVAETAGQILLTVKPSRGGDLLIPLHEDLITGIDRKKKVIKMNLPEGLTGINS